jgi:hypothetical protein
MVWWPMNWEKIKRKWPWCIPRIICTRCPDRFSNLALLQYTSRALTFFFPLWRYSPNLGLDLPPWNSPFHFGLLDLRHSVGLLGRVISSSQGTEKRTHQISMTWVGFKPTIPASERAKTVHALDGSAIVTDALTLCYPSYSHWTVRQVSYCVKFRFKW